MEMLRDIRWDMVAMRVYMAVNYLAAGTHKLVTRLSETAMPNVWVLFEGYNAFLPLWKVYAKDAATAPIAMYFAPENYAMYLGLESDAKKKLPWLSAQIKYKDITLYSLDEFVEKIRYEDMLVMTPASIVAAWSVTQGVILNTNLELTLEVIDDRANLRHFPISSTSSIFMMPRLADMAPSSVEDVD